MASLTNTKIKDTYDGLLKTTDNDALGGTYKLITDGLGNSSGLYLGTGGRLGIGTSSPDRNLTIKNSSDGVNGLSFQSYAANTEVGYIRYEQTNDILDIVNTSSFGNSGIKFSTNNTERLLITSDGKLGLGTSSPRGILDIDGTRGAYFTTLGSGSYQLIGGNTTSASAAFRIDAVSTGSGAELQFATDGSLAMTIDSSQRVGIGTSSPDHKLHLEESDTTSVFLKTENTAGALLVGNNSAGNSFVSSQTSGKDLLFETANSERMRLDSSGNLGLGNSSPTTDSLAGNGGLVIGNGSGNKGITIFGSSTSQQNIAFTDTSSSQQGLIQYDHSGDYMRFFTSSSERLRIDSSGNLTLDPNGNGAAYLKLNTLSGASGDGHIILQRGGSNKFQIAANNSNALTFYNYTAGSTSMTIDSSGNVGIGTTSPSTPLEVNVTGNNTVFSLTRDTGTNGELTIDFDGANANFDSLQGGYTFQIGGTNRFAIDSSGNVSVRDGKTLNILNSVNSAGGSLVCIGGGSLALRSYGNEMIVLNEDSFIQFKVGSGSEKMRLDGNGRLGIGTSSPSAKLEVKGSGDGDLFIGRHSSTGAKLIYGYQSASDGFLELRTAGDVTVSKLSGYIGTPSYFKSNVGIGTTSPAQTLNVVNTSNYQLRLGTPSASSVYWEMGRDNVTTGDFLVSNNTGEKMRITSDGKLGLNTSSITDSRVQIKGAGNATNTYVDGLKVTSNNETVYTQYNWNGINNNTALSFATGGTERMLIASDGGIFAYNLLASTSVSNPQIRLNISTKELYYQSSSLRYKEEVENLDSQIDKLMNLRTVKFKVKGTNEDATGLIAEEVAEVIPELTFKNKVEGFDEPQIDGVSYGDLPTYLLKAIQEQQEMINELKSEIQTLKSQINS